jgi:phenylalanyl-tRNA synthetase beta chain
MVISDDNGVESIAGIMGGEETGCTDETVNVFLEAPIGTRSTSPIRPRAEDQFRRALPVRARRGPGLHLPGLEAATP